MTYGDMLEAMARITPSQPNDAMARIASRRNRTISLDPNLPGQISERFFGRRFKIVLEGPNRFKKGLGDDKQKKNTQSRSQKPQFYVQPTAVSAGSPPVVRRLFEVISEPHTGARPSVRLCVGLIMFFLCYFFKMFVHLISFQISIDVTLNKSKHIFFVQNID